MLVIPVILATLSICFLVYIAKVTVGQSIRSAVECTVEKKAKKPAVSTKTEVDSTEKSDIDFVTLGIMEFFEGHNLNKDEGYTLADKTGNEFSFANWEIASNKHSCVINVRDNTGEIIGNAHVILNDKNNIDKLVFFIENNMYEVPLSEGISYDNYVTYYSKLLGNYEVAKDLNFKCGESIDNNNWQEFNLLEVAHREKTSLNVYDIEACTQVLKEEFHCSDVDMSDVEHVMFKADRSHVEVYELQECEEEIEAITERELEAITLANEYEAKYGSINAEIQEEKPACEESAMFYAEEFGSTEEDDYEAFDELDPEEMNQFIIESMESVSDEDVKAIVANMPPTFTIESDEEEPMFI